MSVDGTLPLDGHPSKTAVKELKTPKTSMITPKTP